MPCFFPRVIRKRKTAEYQRIVPCGRSEEMLRIKRKLSFKVGQRGQIDRRLEALGKTIAEEQKRIKCCARNFLKLSIKCFAGE